MGRIGLGRGACASAAEEDRGSDAAESMRVPLDTCRRRVIAGMSPQSSVTCAEVMTFFQRSTSSWK